MMNRTNAGRGVAMGALWGLSTLAVTARADDARAVDDVPFATFVEVDPRRVPAGEDPQPRGGGRHILFLQRCVGGLTVTQGDGGSIHDESRILEAGTVEFPPFPYGDAAWSEVVQRTRAMFEPFDITVTDVEPGDVPHDEVIVCGEATSAGFAGAGGVAPFNCGVIPNAVSFAFAQTLGNNPERIAHVVAQEAAHAWGLDHAYLCEDPMSYLSGCGPKAFQDVDAPCGEGTPRACTCGSDTQNSYRHIVETFGASSSAPPTLTAEITSPRDGDVIATGSAFDIRILVSEDVELSGVTLYVDGRARGYDDTPPYGPWPVTDIADGVYELYVEATDTAGNFVMSPVVTLRVSADGRPVDPDADDETEGESGASPHGSADRDEGLEDDGLEDDGSGSPLDGGEGSRAWARAGDGCACAARGDRGRAGAGMLLLGLWGLRARRRSRRRRARR